MTVKIVQRSKGLLVFVMPVGVVFFVWKAFFLLRGAVDTLGFDGLDIGTRVASALIMSSAAGLVLLISAAATVGFFWALFGSEELDVSDNHVSIRVSIRVFEWSASYPASDIDEVVYKFRFWHRPQSLLLFGGRIQNGKIGLKLGKTVRYFGANLKEKQARSIVQAIRSTLPARGTA